jgi:Uncharacterized protein conserved in bacteria (DUF2264).
VLFYWLLVNMSVIWKLLKIRIAPTGAICFIRWQLPYWATWRKVIWKRICW